MEVAEVEEVVRKHALKNAVLHDGRADLNAVVRKLLAERPEVKPRLRELIGLVRRVVEEVNRLSLDEQRRVLEERYPEALEAPRRAREGLPPLPRAEGFDLVVTRFAPEPNGYLHLGHAKAAILSHEYARMYGGKFILRFEDTNPRVEKVEYYEAIREDLRELGVKWDEERLVSDDMEEMYRAAREIVARGLGYVCTCPLKLLRARRRRGEECECRSRGVDESLELLDRMLEGAFKEGEAVVRLKTDMRSENLAFRDPVLLRVIDHPHPLKGDRYVVYPTYDFACVVEDHLMKVSHVLRSIEFEARVQVQEAIYAAMGWRPPVAIQFGRLSMEGAPLSKRRIAPLIREGVISGWDDPRLATIRGLRRRGVHPEAIRRLILDIGPSRANALITWELLSSYNRKVVDPIANRLFFVPRPRLMVVEGAPRVGRVELKLHPNHPERGVRVIELDEREGELQVYVPGDEVGRLAEAGRFRLMGLFNVELVEVGEELRARYAGDELIDPKIQWVPAGRGVRVKVYVPGRLFRGDELEPDSMRVEEGVGEEACRRLKPGEVVQFERYGFVRVDRVGEEVEVIFAHR